MTEIRRYPVLSHLRSEPSSHILFYQRGILKRSGRGLAFWFRPLAASIARIPVDDREQAFLFTGRSEDFQDVYVQGAIQYRIVEPETTALRIDFGLDLIQGVYSGEPLEQLAAIVTQLAQQYVLDTIAHTPMKTVLKDGVRQIRQRIQEGFSEGVELRDLGIEVVAVRLSSVSPSADMEKALQTPALEGIQQQADQATFERRALAVEKERAIAENELQNQIELARREENLIEQRGQNESRRMREEAESKRIEVEANAENERLISAARADSMRTVEAARNEAEREKMAIYRDLPPAVTLGLAAQELAGNLNTIEHLNLSPDAFGPLLTQLLSAGTRRLEDES
jgi:regulator of protease activity HflC (stomatin/prohibitin superfamily)